MNRALLAASSLLAFLHTSVAQIATDPNDGLWITRDSPGVFTMRWYGRAGWTYFVQQSLDLQTWTYRPDIEKGLNLVIPYGLQTNAQKYFLRLRRTDIPTNDPFNADFDGDKISNIDELNAGLDPLSDPNTADSDGDTLPDDWERRYFGRLSFSAADDPHQSGQSNADAFQSNSNPTIPFPAATRVRALVPDREADATYPDDTEIAIKWDSPGDSRIQSFRVEWSQDGGSWAALQSCVPSQTSVPVTGLLAKRAYAFRVVAIGPGAIKSVSETVDYQVPFLKALELRTTRSRYDYPADFVRLTGSTYTKYRHYNATHSESISGGGDVLYVEVEYNQHLDTENAIEWAYVDSNQNSDTYGNIFDDVEYNEHNPHFTGPGISDFDPGYSTYGRSDFFDEVIEHGLVLTLVRGVPPVFNTADYPNLRGIVPTEDGPGDRFGNVLKYGWCWWAGSPFDYTDEDDGDYHIATETYSEAFSTAAMIALTEKNLQSFQWEWDDYEPFWEWGSDFSRFTAFGGTQWTEDFGYNYVKDQGFASFLPSYVPANIQIASRDLLPAETKYSVARGQVRFVVNPPAVDAKIQLVHMFSPEGLPDPDPEDGLPGPPPPPPQFVDLELSVTAFEVASSDAEVNPTSQLCLGYHQDGTHTLSPLSVGLVDAKDDTLENGNDVQIIPKKNSADTNILSVAWIDPHRLNSGNDPDMPWLVLRMNGMEQLGLKIRWKLQVKYERPNGQVLPEDTILFPSADTTPSDWVTEPLTGPIAIWANNGWINALLSNGFFGGDATLTYQILKPDNSIIGDEKMVLFSIGGRNPERAKCKDYIDDNATSAHGHMWFAYAIAKSESSAFNPERRYNQFWERTGSYDKRPHKQGEPTWTKFRTEESAGGFGMFQVTGSIVSKFVNIPREQIWNWQTHSVAALVIIRHKQDAVYDGSWDYMNGTMAHRDKPGEPRGQRPQAKKANNNVDVPVPDETVGSVAFKDGTARTIEAAVTMKAYNGAISHYCGWDNATRTWKFSRTNGTFNYVDRVCQEVE